MGSRLRGNDRGMIVAARVDAGGTQSARIRRKICWRRRAGSNRQPIAYEASALPLSYCGVQKEPCSTLLSNKPPPVEQAQSVLPAPPATADHPIWNIHSRSR